MDANMQNILDHYHEPENAGVLLNATSCIELKNISCGDEITVYVQLVDGVLQDVSFQGKGCAISQAAMSMLSEEVKGMPKDQILALDKDFVLELLGIEVGPVRLKCALLGMQALKQALEA